MKKLLCIAAAPLALFCGMATASVTGSVTYVNPDTVAPNAFKYLSTPPAVLGNNNINVNDTVFAFSEKQSTVFGNAPTVDLGGPIASGVLVSSYYVYFDPKISQQIKASLTFSEAILGVYFVTGNADTSPGGVFHSGTGLKGSADNFGLSTVSYQYVAATGLEAADRSASHFSFLGNSLSLNWTASNPGDHIRVLTAAPMVTAVPEPESYAMLLAGLGLIGSIVVRRRSEQS
jgi:hypothetical protein